MAEGPVVVNLTTTNLSRGQSGQTYTFEIPATATVADAVKLFRDNHASRWLADTDLCAKVGIRLSCHRGNLPDPDQPNPNHFPSYKPSDPPNIPEADLHKNAVACGLRSGSWSFRQIPPGALD